MFGLSAKASFKGDDGVKIELYSDHVECKGETHGLSGVTARVESGSEMESRVTLTRFIAFGLFSLAFKKRKGGEKYLTVEGPDFAWMTLVNRKHIPEAMRFMITVNDTARKSSAEALSTPKERPAVAKATGHETTKHMTDELTILNQRYADGDISFANYMAAKNRLL